MSGAGIELELWVEEGPDEVSRTVFMMICGVLHACVVRPDDEVAVWFEVPGPWVP